MTGQQTRRAALGAITTLSALALAPTPSWPEGQDADGRALTLWAKRHALRQPFLEAYRAEHESEARMSWWAKPGPEFLAADGSTFGTGVGWPAIADAQHPRHSKQAILIRPGKGDLRRLFEADIPLDGEDFALKTYRHRLRSLAERIRAQKEEGPRSGYTDASAKVQAIYEQVKSIEDEIEALEPSSPHVVAAQILLSALSELAVCESAELAIAATAIRYLRPGLRGILAEHIDELNDNPDGRLGSCQVYVADYDQGKVLA
jgi:hypothetical protein